MNIQIVKLEKYNIETFNMIASWNNDPDIKEYIIPRRSEEELKDVTGEMLMSSASKKPSKKVYIVLDDKKPIGNYSIESGFEGLMSKHVKTAWIGVLIGEKDYWGKGISKMIMSHIEKECRAMGFEYIELGVFEFNERAIKLYRSMGYEELGTIPDFVFHNGHWMKDIRMIKKI